MDGISLERFRQSLKLALPPIIIDVRAESAHASCWRRNPWSHPPRS